ncbi:MAG: hypothetical protein J5838_04785 [Desulfovibrio sp.]|nr:hypothetical protein [Desulfovibrio sp.]
MWKTACLSVLCTMVLLCSAQAWAADARQAAYLKAARNFVEKHTFPDGEVIDKADLSGNFGENELAICDVDGDGKPELIVRFTSGPMASQLEYVCGFDESAGKLTVKFTGFPGVEYYSNGCAKEKVSHNQGLAGDFWPYSLSMYDAKEGKYVLKGSVDAWSKKAYPTNPFENDKPFPANIDATGDGFVYFIDDEKFEGAKGGETPVDTPVYEEWVKRYLGGAAPVNVAWVPATGEGLKALETNLYTTAPRN